MSTDENIPTTERIRDVYVKAVLNNRHHEEGLAEFYGYAPDTSDPGADFDAWLAKHDAETLARAAR